MVKKTAKKEKDLSNELALQEAFSQMFENEDDYDDMCDDHDLGRELMASVLTTLNQQMQIALELTRMVHANHANSAPIDEEKLFATFRKAVQTAEDVYPLANFMEKFDNAL